MRLQSKATRSVLAVGQGGRGFAVKIGYGWQSRRIVFTCAHCLPKLPPSDPGAFSEEKTYHLILGALGQLPSISAECLFVDPVSDVALLGPPDNQTYFEQSGAFDALLDEAFPLRIGDIPPCVDVEARLLSLENCWFPCRVKHDGGGLWIRDASLGIRPGMSGSPILNKKGMAVGIVSTGRGKGRGGPNPRLVHHLPAWALPGKRYPSPPVD
jgi:Peptidase S7, Flavivirus NS3 serine protease